MAATSLGEVAEGLEPWCEQPPAQLLQLRWL